MGIHTVVWICENCGKIDVYSEDVSPWDDPVIRAPDGWDYIGADEKFVCAECVKEA